jgi:hypothetical protein
MKNLYAYSPEKELQHIRHVDKSLKLAYACLNCEGILIPRKGKINAHHFAHKAEGNCSYETYLHKVAKLKFYYTYKSCLDNKTPFTLTWQEKRTCNACQDIKGVNISCDLEDETKKSDLTKTFDTISIEKKHNGFIADILLESTKTDKVLFIEFAVTHKCELEKRTSGFPIIEINLTSDDDLQFLESEQPFISLEKTTKYGMPDIHKNNNYISPNKCKKEFEFGVVFKSHKTLFKRYPMWHLTSMIKKEEVIYTKLEPERDYDYFGEQQETFLMEALNKGVKVKNCLTCRFSVYNDWSWNDHWFCKKLKYRFTSFNDGSTCDKHWMKEKTPLY